MSELSKINIDGIVYDVKDAVARKKLILVTGATVGQTILISEVDENGVPTAWEAVEFPNDAHINGLIDAKLEVIENGTY